MNTSPGMTDAFAGADVGARRRHQLRSALRAPARRRHRSTPAGAAPAAGSLTRWPPRPCARHDGGAAAARRAPDERDRRACSRLVAAVAARRRWRCSGWRASRCSRSASISVDGDVGRNSVSTIRANAAPQLAGNFFTLDLRAVRARLRVGAVGAPWRSCGASGRTACGCSSRSTGRSRSGAARAATRSSSTASARCSRPTSATSRTTTCRRSPGPDGSSAQVLAMLGRVEAARSRRSARASRRSRSRAAARGRRRSTAARSSSSAAAATTRCSRAPRASSPRVRQVTSRYQRPLEYADLRHTDGYAVRLKGVSTHDRRGVGQDSRKRRREARWPRKSRTSSSASTSAPPR